MRRARALGEMAEPQVAEFVRQDEGDLVVRLRLIDEAEGDHDRIIRQRIGVVDVEPDHVHLRRRRLGVGPAGVELGDHLADPRLGLRHAQARGLVAALAQRIGKAQ